MLTLVWFLYMGIVPSGHISYQTSFRRVDSFLGRLSPSERVLSASDKQPHIISADPVYFSLYTPRRFEKIKLKYRYRRVGNGDVLIAPIIETGVLVDQTIWRYDLHPVENLMIDNLPPSWSATRKGDSVLYEREVGENLPNPRYGDVDNFLNNPPNFTKIALYNYDFKKNYKLADYIATSTILAQDLRGAYQFYVYSGGDDLKIDFSFDDLNKNRDADQIDLQLYYQGKLIEAAHLDDDGVALDNGSLSIDRKLSLGASNLPEGTYKIELRSNDDIVTREIRSNSSKLAFVGSLWLMESGTGNISLWTDGNFLQAKTVNPGSLQTIKAGKNDLVISETYKQFETSFVKQSAFDDFAQIKLAHDGIILSSNGVLAFSENSLINPRISRVDANLDLQKRDIHYILAEYQSPQIENNWKVAEIDLDLRGAYREDGKYSFIISAPGLEKSGTYIEFDSIEAELIGRSLWKKVRGL